MIRSLINLRAVDLGFQTESTVAARVSLPSAKYESVEQRRAFFDALLTRVRSMPGVASASIATTRPFACCAPATVVSDAFKPGTSVAAAPTTDVRYVDDAYFSTLRIAVAAGSVFGPSESPVGPPRAVVSRSLARALWAGENAIGRRISIKLFGNTVAEVIGVVDDVHLADARTPSRPAVFLSTDRFPSTERDVIVRGSGDASALLGALRQSLAAVDATIPLYRATSLDRAVATTMAQDRLTTALLAAFAVLALLLAAVGVYGVLSGDVTRRRKEIGIRLALGANAGAVTSMVLRRALTPAVVGVAIGIVLALVLARSMSALVFGIGAYDAVTFVGVTVTLLVVAAGASIVPAVRATRVSPLEAIRTD
jgi:putative ABC transport system permease protein